MQPYRDIDARGQGAGAYLESLESEGTVSLKKAGAAMDQPSTIVELRNELHSLGMQYQELSDGLLVDLMGQMRDAKLVLFQTVDEVDGRISKRVDRIEAEMHSKLLNEIEGRVAERVRAMEQTSSRLERCFDKMEGRIGALETVLASKRPRPESMYQLLQQQLQQLQQQEEGGTLALTADTVGGFSSVAEPAIVPYVRPRRRTLAENGYSPPDGPALPQRDTSEVKPTQSPAACTSTSSVTEQAHGVSHHHHKPYNPANHPLVSSPLEGFVSHAQGQPVWSPISGISASAISPPIPTSGGSTAVVASPLERGTLIGSRIGTIHPEYQPQTSSVPSSDMPSKEKIQGGGANSSAGLGQGSRIRRVSLPSFDSNSLSSLKPIKATTITASESPLTTSIVTTTTTTTTMTTKMNKQSLGVKSTSSLLTAKINAASAAVGSSDAAASGGQGPSFGVGSGGAAISATMQRAMTFDSLHTQASTSSTITKTVKTPVQGPSSYRELLHFWKAGGSGSSSGVSQ